MAEGKIHLNGEVWTWEMPSSAYVLIRDPNRKKTVVAPYIVEQEWRKEQDARKLPDPKHSFNRNFYTNITPAMVKVYIQKNLA